MIDSTQPAAQTHLITQTRPTAQTQSIAQTQVIAQPFRDVHPGAVRRPPPGGRPCADDAGGDGRAHILLVSETEREGLHWLSYWHGWWPWFTTVSYVSWWPEHGIVNDRQGIRDRGGAHLTTFAEFRKDQADTVLYWLDYLNDPH